MNDTDKNIPPKPVLGGACASGGASCTAKKRVLPRAFLYATGFFSGMSVMAIELGASRLLAPYFSSSQIVWTVIIGTIMIAMAIGNVWGGRSSDKNPDPSRLYRRLALAALWCALIPFAGKYIITGISVGLALVVSSNYLIWASFASCILVFVFPLMILGTVTPSLMKYATTSLSDNGRTVGELEALGTIGSIIGTFLPTFVTIPAVGTAITFLIFALVLALLCAIYFIWSGGARRHTVTSCALCAAVVCGMFLPRGSYAFWESGNIYEDESIYNYLKVTENDRETALSTNVMIGVQSVYIKGGSLTGMYYDYALAAPLMAENAVKALVLGMGTGTFATQCANYFPSLEVTGVEIDEKIAALAYDRFCLPENVPTVVGDGRAYLAQSIRAGEKWDVIMVDAYQDITIPFQMSTVEFFTQVKNALSDGGVMVVNLNMTSSDDGTINQWLCETIRSVFGEVCTADVSGGTNTVLFAAKSGSLADKLEKNIQPLDANSRLYSMMDHVASSLEAVTPGSHILTDDRAPVELLGMRVLDSMISAELSSVRETLQNEGIAGFLQ
ncbi:MAG: fused MFS/spermidine synthase [Eubacteriales bacterium]